MEYGYLWPTSLFQVPSPEGCTVGLGTMISACTDREQDQTDCAVFFCGVAQFILGFILIGWVWSLFWGVKIYSKSRPKVRVVSTNTVQIMEHS